MVPGDFSCFSTLPWAAKSRYVILRTTPPRGRALFDGSYIVLIQVPEKIGHVLRPTLIDSLMRAMLAEPPDEC
jgi:hypothetical protein